MTIALTYVTQASILTSTPLTTASVDPAANELWLVFLGLRLQTQVATISGGGLSWAQVAMLQNAQNAHRIYLWRGLSTSDPSAAAITITMTGNTKPALVLVMKATGIDTTGSDGSGAVEGVVTGGVDAVTDTDDMKIDVTTTRANGVIVGFGSHRNRTLTVPAGQAAVSASTLNEQAGTGGDLVGLSIWFDEIAAASANTIGADNDLNLTTEWSIIGIGLKEPAGAALLEVVDEITDITEAASRHADRTIQVVENVWLHESVLHFRTLIQRIAEALGIGETPLRSMVLARIHADTVAITENVTRLRAYLLSIAETVDIIETAQRLSNLFRAIDETVGITEAAQRLSGLRRSIDEAVGITEVANRLKAMTRQIVETVNVNEAIQRTRTLARVIDEALGITETVGRFKAMVRAIAETVNITESVLDLLVVAANDLIKQIDESLSITETTNRLMAMVRQGAESIGILETTDRAMTLVRSVAETVGITEVINRAATWIRTINETVNITETIRRIRGTSQVISETVNIIEATAGILGVAGQFLRTTFKGMYRGMFKRM